MILADQINYLGANNATTAAEIAEVVNDAAGLGQVAGMSPASTSALGTAVLAMNTSESRAATRISRIYTNMSLGASATDAQQAMWEELGFSAEGIAKSMQINSTGTMLSVFEAIGNLDKDRQVAALKTLFGQWAIQGAAKLTGNLPVLEDTLRMAYSPDLYTGSMAREFAIKSGTTENLDLLLNNSLLALQVDVGKMFLAAKQQITQALINFLNQIRAMPKLGQVAESLAGLLSSAIEKAGVVLEKSLPVIQQVLGYMATHGEQIAKGLKGLVVTFAGMKFALALVGLSGNSSSGGISEKQSGGLLGAMGSLFHWGQNITRR